MADLTEEELRRAEVRGRRTLEAEPRATAAHYDPATGRVVIELANGCVYAFPAERVQDLQGASDEDLADMEVDGAGFDPAKAGRGPLRPGSRRGRFRNSCLDRARVGSRRRPSEIAREGGGGPLQRGQRGAAAQGGKGLTIAYCSSRARRADLGRDVDQWRPG